MGSNRSVIQGSLYYIKREQKIYINVYVDGP